jgi:hypothetical protein
MLKKLFALLLCALFLVAFVGCKDDECTECEECEECEVCQEPEECDPEDLTPSPVVTPVVYHWVPGAVLGNVTATVDLKGAESLMVLLHGRVLEDLVDYELDDDELTIFGDTLDALDLPLGKHVVTIVTENGTDTFEIDVVLTAAEATSIPTKTIKDVDFTQLASVKPTAVIADAPELLITEIGVEMNEYSFIEIFNNTNAEYNLKNHRIVFSDLTKQTLLASKGLFEQPLGMACAAFIYQDYKIPALSSAIIWLVASYPWVQSDGTLPDGTAGKVMAEEEGAAVHLFGSNSANLSIAKFRDVYGLDNSVLVFPVRPQPCLMNSTSYGDSNGFGASPIKAASSRFASFNSSVANRGVQIQKFDLEKKINVENAPEYPAATYYKYDVGVVNKEEDVYTNGVFDRTKIQVHGKRESVNSFYARIAYYNASDQFLGYAEGANAVDTYNAPVAGKAYLQMYNDIVTPIVTALIYGKVVEVEGVKSFAKWGEYRGLQYTLPVAGSTLMRYIPLVGTRADYVAIFSNDGVTDAAVIALNTYKLSGVAAEVPEITANTDILVFESEVYPVDYLRNGYNTIGRGIAVNFTAPAQ